MTDKSDITDAELDEIEEAVPMFREFLQNPLSPDCSVRLLVSGPITSKELRRLRHLIYFLELWHDPGESLQSELAREIEEKTNKASEPPG